MYREALSAAQDSVDPETGEIDDSWSEFLDTVEDSLHGKALACAAMSRELLVSAEATAIEAKRIHKMQLSLERQSESLKNYIARNLPAGEKIRNDYISISWRKSQAVIIDDESVLPDEYWKVKREVSKSIIKDAVKKGTQVPGAHIEEKMNVSIK